MRRICQEHIQPIQLFGESHLTSETRAATTSTDGVRKQRSKAHSHAEATNYSVKSLRRSESTSSSNHCRSSGIMSGNLSNHCGWIMTCALGVTGPTRVSHDHRYYGLRSKPDELGTRTENRIAALRYGILWHIWKRMQENTIICSMANQRGKTGIENIFCPRVRVLDLICQCNWVITPLHWQPVIPRNLAVRGRMGKQRYVFMTVFCNVEKIMTPYLQKILPNTTRHRNPFAINCCKIHLHPAQDQTIITYWGKPNHITVQIKLSVSNKILATYVTSEVSGAPSTGVTKDINGRAPEILKRPKRSAVASIVSCSNHEIEVLPQFRNGTCVVFVVFTLTPLAHQHHL